MEVCQKDIGANLNELPMVKGEIFLGTKYKSWIIRQRINKYR